jgi:DNA-binding transcriptional MerR regulator
MEERFSQNFNKLYYSIGEVADLFGVNASLIRFWEKEFDAIKPKKNAKGNRKFTPNDIEILTRIYQLVKVEGFTLDGAKKALTTKSKSINLSNSPVDIDKEALKTSLLQIRNKLSALKH